MLDNLNVELQGKGGSVINSVDKMKSYVLKLSNWRRKIQEGLTVMFEKLGEIVDVNDVPQHLCGDIAEHLSCLKGEFDHYFPDITTECCWLVTKPITAPDSEEETQNELLQLQTDSAAKIKWEECSYLIFGQQ